MVASVPKDPKVRSDWIKYQLARRGLNLTDLAKRLNISRQAVSNTLRSPNLRAQEAIAKAINIAPEYLWPERYDADGNPCHRTAPSGARCHDNQSISTH
ncbi:MAG: helix-turn-helix domain-containing protein [Mycobacterium sp.]